MHLYSTVCQYMNISYIDAKEIACDEFMLMYKNALVSKLMESEEGRKEIETYYRMKKTSPDINSLREKFK